MKIFVFMFLNLSLSGALMASQGPLTEIKVFVKGMVCGFCAQGITKKFSNEPGVEKVDVSLEKRQLVLSLRKDHDISDRRITDLLRDSGFNVELVKRGVGP